MRKHRSDKVIALVTIVLMLVGLMVIFVVGPMRANYLNAAYGTEVVGENEYFLHQLVSVMVSLLAFIVAFKFPYEKTFKIGKWILLAGILLSLLLMFLALIGSSAANCTNGACRWINVGGGISVQPTEVMKLGLVIYLAGLIAERKQEGKLEKAEFFLPFLIVVAVAVGLTVVAQKDLGSGVSMVMIVVVMLFVSGMKWWKVVGVLGGIIVLAVLAILTSPHRMERVLTYVGGGDDYHIENALMAIGSGGLVGVGIGNSVEATGYLPESINDSVFAVMGETFGFLGLMLVVVSFMVLGLRLLKLADTASDERHMLVAMGMFGWIITQAAVNIMAMSGMIPLTGVTLPLLSYGGTSMVFIAVGLGLCLQLSCFTERRQKDESANRGRGLRRAYHTSRRGTA